MDPIKLHNREKQQDAQWPYAAVLVHALAVSCTVALGTVLWTLFRGTWDFAATGLAGLSYENGPLENTQTILLAIAASLGFASAFRTTTPLWRYVAISLACIAVVGWSREIQSYDPSIPLEGFTLPRFVKRAITGLALITFGITSLRMLRHRAKLTALFSPKFVWPIFVLGAILVGAELCEEQGLVFLEEWLEVYAYSMMAITCNWILINRVDLKANTPSAEATDQLKAG